MMLKKINTLIEKTVDRALLAISPRRYHLRQHFQRLDNDYEYRDAYLLAMRVRGYKAARGGTGKAPWTGLGRSADSEILNDLPTLRARGRELSQDDSLGSGLKSTFVSNVIGTGMTAQARTGTREKDNRLESIWKTRCNNLSPADDMGHGEVQRMVLGKVFEDGEVLRKAVYLPGEPVWFETIEAERLATPMDKSTDQRIRAGVERDDYGRPVAYWIMRGHPGDTLSAQGMALDSRAYQRIEKPYICHLRLAERPGQTRGVPACHAILQDLRDLDLLMVASLKRTQIAACLSAFIKTEALTPDFMDVTAQKYGYVLDQQIEPGMLFKLYPNESIETLVPNFPTPELGPFIIMLARRIGAALGVCWQMVLKDFSQSTYSSARTDLLESRVIFRILQKYFIERYLNWEWALVMQDAQLRGDPRAAGMTPEDLIAVQWIPNGWLWVDPEKEAAAAKIELEIGTKTLRDLCAEKGQDWEELQDQRLEEELREQTRRKELGLPPKINPDQPPVGRPAAAEGNGNGSGKREFERTLTL